MVNGRFDGGALSGILSLLSRSGVLLYPTSGTPDLVVDENIDEYDGRFIQMTLD